MYEPPEEPEPAPTEYGPEPHYGSGYDSIGFRGIGADLLKTFPSLTPPVLPKADMPIVPAVHGSHLVSPMQAGSDGYRVSSCPVCLAHSVVPQLAGGWVPLRCASCGTEFVASDGSPPPAPTIAKPVAAVSPSKGESRWLSVILLGDGGQRLSRCPACYTIEIVPGSGTRVDMRCGTCGSEYTATATLPAHSPPPSPRPATLPPPRPGPIPPLRGFAPPPPPSSPTRHTDDVLTDSAGRKSVICPLCRKFKVDLPRVSPTFTLSVTCPGCRNPFTVNLRGAKKPSPFATPESSRPKKRKLFRGTPGWERILTIIFAFCATLFLVGLFFKPLLSWLWDYLPSLGG